MLKEIRTQRAIGLAKIYGPFVRFSPEGNEGAVDDAIKTSEDADKSPEDQKAIDDARKAEQQIEQERSNTRRANEKAAAAEAAVVTARQETQRLQDQLADAEAKAAEAGIENVELDETNYEGSDLAIIRKIKSLDDQIKAKDQRIAGLEKKASDFETAQKADIAKAEADSAYDEILSDLDEEYGTDCRNTALKEFNALVADGKVPKNRPGKATLILSQCYRNAKVAKPDKKADLDTGQGGGHSASLTGIEIKEGSLDDVAKQMEAASSG